MSKDVQSAPRGWELESSDTTAVVPRYGAVATVLIRAQSLHAWGFVAVATFTFCVVYVALYKFAPHERASGEPRARATVIVPAPAGGPRQPTGPLIVRSGQAR